MKELLQVTLFARGEEKNALKQQIHTSVDAHLDEVVAEMSLPILNGVLRITSLA